jgi:hypothetical protein
MCSLLLSQLSSSQKAVDFQKPDLLRLGGHVAIGGCSIMSSKKPRSRCMGTAARDVVPMLSVANVTKIVWVASFLFGFAEPASTPASKIACMSALLSAGFLMRTNEVGGGWSVHWSIVP